MKKARIAEVQHNFSSVLKLVEQGKDVYITRRNKVIAKIIPVYNETAAELPPFYERSKKLFANRKGKDPGQIILESRKDRI